MSRERDTRPGRPGAEQPTIPQRVGELASAETIAAEATVPGAPGAEVAATVPGPSGAEVAATLPSGPGAEVAATLPSGPGAGGAAPEGRVGERFGELVVLSKLGSGGMGEVFAAYDPQLDRKVAVKVLRRDAGGKEAHDRLLREAQAMAQLSHPNVITVHQVGVREGQVFVVMEHVSGGTLREWMGESRPWRDVLAIFADAGRGLASAHRAGLVHRDFKPDNVLIRADGRVAVTDFGLVAATGSEPTGSGSATRGKEPSLSTSSSSRLAVELTRTGAVMGTPLYMAPEQHRGERVDARADQFAFCVALYEALYGRRPFGGQTYQEVVENVHRGVPRPPPEGVQAPRWLFEVVSRGLQCERDERYPDMDALLDALGRDPAALRRRRWLLPSALFGVVGLAGLLFWLWPDPAGRCRAAGEALDRVWNEERRASIRSGWPVGAAHADRVIAALDRYGAAWGRERVRTCEATYVKGEQSEQLLDQRMLCLDGRLRELEALVVRLRSPTLAVAQAATVAVGRLPRLEECGDRQALSEQAPAPRESRKAIEAISQQLDQAEAHRALGELDQGKKVAGAALSRAREIGYAPLLARAHYVAGLLDARLGAQREGERHLREAIRRAGEGRAYYREAEAWLSLIYLVGHERGDSATALALAPAAEAAVGRISGDASFRGRLEGNLGLVLLTQGELGKARVRLERSLKIFEQALGAEDLDTAIARNNLALVLERLGEHREAMAALVQVLAVRQRLLGPEHPDVATTLNDLGNSAHSLGELGKARGYLERALAIRLKVLGEGHLRTAHTLNNLAIVLGDMGQTEAAAAQARQAVAVTERAVGKNHVELAGPLNTLGNQLRELGKPREAWEAFARGLAIVEQARGQDHIDVAPLVENLARMLVQLGHLDRGLELIDRAITVRTRAQGLTHPETINAVAVRGSINLQGKRMEAAVADFEREVTLAEKAFGPGHVETALAHYNLAVALEQGGKLGRAAKSYWAALHAFDRGAPTHRHVASAWRGLGDIATARKQPMEAGGFYERAVEAASPANPALGDLLQLQAGALGAQGRHREAVVLLERAVTVRRGAGDSALVALAEQQLARALWDGKLDRARALELARHARGLFVAAGERAEDNVKELDAWLRGKAP